MGKHTPGPWEAVNSGHPNWTIFAKGMMIAVVRVKPYPPSQKLVSLPVEANARLMAEAPALKAENQQLRQENAALRGACQALTDDDRLWYWSVDGDGPACVFCGAVEPREQTSIPHRETCPVLEARRAIAAAGGEEVA